MVRTVEIRNGHALLVLLLPPSLLAIPMFALAALSGAAGLLEAGIGLGGIGLSTFLSAHRQRREGELWLIPTLVGFGILALLASATLISELLAAIGGLGILYWISTTASSGLSRGPAGLVLPGLAVALAISVTLFLPGGPALVGVASAILVIVLLGVAGVIRISVGESEGGPSSS